MDPAFSFVKLYVGDEPPVEAAKALLTWFGQHCTTHGLLPVSHEDAAQFSLLLIVGESRWLHCDFRGHFLPENGDQYATIVQLLSRNYPTVNYRATDGGPYVLRRFDGEKVTARYAVYGDAGHYESRAAADPWKPVYAAWQGIMALDVQADEFYRLLPAPRYPGATESEEIDYFDLPEHFNRIFGWNRELNYACIEFSPDGPDGRGDFYEPEAGDYVDKERSLKIYVRHYGPSEPVG